jgi:hypothetical protein
MTACLFKEEVKMLKRHLITGFSIALVSLSMGYDAHAKLPWPTPSTPCTSSNEGASATTIYYGVARNAGSTLEYIDYATYLCNSGSWVLADVTRCYMSNGNCVPL